jgi:hypothetical protein
MTNLPDPANDRDEPTDEEVREQIDRTDFGDDIETLCGLIDERAILQWAHTLQHKIHDAIELNRDNQKSDGDE